MVGQLLPNTNEMLQCILSLQNLDLNTARTRKRVRRCRATVCRGQPMMRGLNILNIYWECNNDICILKYICCANMWCDDACAMYVRFLVGCFISVVLASRGIALTNFI
jgi:hypothetical protein